MYNEKVMKYFTKPHNMGEIKNPDGIGKVGNPVCGDLMWLYLKVGKDKQGNEIIKDIKVKTFGCVAAIATSSVLTDMAKGMTLEKALVISKQDIVDELGQLPPEKIHCSVLASDALKKAIEDYYSHKAKSDKNEKSAKPKEKKSKSKKAK
jgi:nitrogen fixation NifU-like protein